ncbi:phage tail protein [Salmonella enterica subsp. enterica serovar Abony]|nr:phage tail protein [Salmonella enterica]EBE3485400.1 phage tail protein [Salmonella enterica subsp. enterica serovar Heidelberg]EBX4896902.1 phage tail protein [Salmonella enterica subsp. enterica serovar Abony]EAT1397818.1 phage tail protein [Salmonella enterica]EAT2099210.1 phage tail protein [Salmonella enterica]
MNDKTPEFWAAVLTGLKNAWPQILGALMAGLIAYGRLIYDGAMGVDSEPQVSVVRFGDGYEQRRASGINNDLKKYSVTIRVDREDGPALEGFLSQHNGVKAFLWTPPYGYRQIKVVCRKWSVKAGLLKTTFTATFEQVISWYF